MFFLVKVWHPDAAPFVLHLWDIEETELGGAEGGAVDVVLMPPTV